MAPIVEAERQSITTHSPRRRAPRPRRLAGWIVLLAIAFGGGGVLAAAKMGAHLPPPLDAPKISAWLDFMAARAGHWKASIGGRLKSLFQGREEEARVGPRKVVATSPLAMDVTVTQRYVCQIHARQHINVCALDSGYLDGIKIQEGQAVRRGDLMFQLRPVLYEAKYKAEMADATLALREFQNTEYLFKKPNPVVSKNEVLLYEARKDRAKAKAEQAKAEWEFTRVVAPFDGIVDRQYAQLGSLIKEGEVLTTLSDNRVMWVYFNVTEAQYLDFTAGSKEDRDQRIELELANHTAFVDGEKHPRAPLRVTVTGQFNNQTGTIPFRADFPNPDGVLRHGQTGTILIHRTLRNALVIPQRATFELLAKRYVWAVGEDGAAHQKLITTSKHELEDVFVVESGIGERDKIVLEGVREVEEGGKVEFEFRKPEEALRDQKFHAE